MAEPIGTIVVSVPEAARLLGISERAVRKRITVGTLAAEREGSGPWQVRLGTADAAPGGTVGGTASEPIDAQYRTVNEPPAVALVPLAAVADQLQGLADRLADMALEVGQLRERTATQQETIAELRRRAEVAERERDELRAHASPQPPSAAPPPSAGVEAATPERPVQRLWQRFRRALGGE